MSNRITTDGNAAESMTNADLHSSSPNNAKPNVGSRFLSNRQRHKK